MRLRGGAVDKLDEQDGASWSRRAADAEASIACNRVVAICHSLTFSRRSRRVGGGNLGPSMARRQPRLSRHVPNQAIHRLDALENTSFGLRGM